MMPALALVPAQANVTGGSPATVAAVFVLLAAASVLSLLVTYRFARGYLQTGTRPFLFLSVGLFLLTAAPIFARLVLVNVVAVPEAHRTLITNGSELLGLLVILHTIYR